MKNTNKELKKCVDNPVKIKQIKTDIEQQKDSQSYDALSDMFDGDEYLIEKYMNE